MDSQANTGVTLEQFLMLLATQALIGLGAVDNVATGKREMNLPGAKYTIDVLGLLEEKTKGNLTTQEADMLGNLLYELRLRYAETLAAQGGEAKDGN